MKMIHVVPHIDAEAAGPSYTVPRLCQSLAARGHEVTLSCLAAASEIPGVRLSVHPSWPIFKGFAVSPAHARNLGMRARQVDIIHNHSLWSMVNVACGWVVPGKRAKLVTSPRGTLSEWALQHSRRRKQALWPLQQRVLTRADLLHATSEEEYGDIRRAGFRAPAAIIPNGIDLPPPRTELQMDTGVRTLLFLSRIHTVKGIERLLDAWAALEDRHPDWQLRIVGPGEPGYVAELERRAAHNGSQRVTFVGPLYDVDKARAYQNADLFVLPTHSENFGMAVAEALAYGCPAIVSQGAPWAGLETNACGWWIPNDVDHLRDTLEAAMALPAQTLQDMGTRGREWMQRDFAWSSIADTMTLAYRWVVEGGDVPECVRLD